MQENKDNFWLGFIPKKIPSLSIFILGIIAVIFAVFSCVSMIVLACYVYNKSLSSDTGNLLTTSTRDKINTNISNQGEKDRDNTHKETLIMGEFFFEESFLNKNINIQQNTEHFKNIENRSGFSPEQVVFMALGKHIAAIYDNFSLDNITESTFYSNNYRKYFNDLLDRAEEIFGDRYLDFDPILGAQDFASGLKIEQSVEINGVVQVYFTNIGRNRAILIKEDEMWRIEAID